MTAATPKGRGHFSHAWPVAVPLLHPATWIILGFFFLGIVHALRGVEMLYAFLPILLAGKAPIKRGFHMIWRARWLLTAVFVFPAWAVAGQPLWPSDYAPTHEGIGEALVQSGRLLLTLLAVGIVLEKVSASGLPVALRTLMKPLACCLGASNVERGIVRLLLVLRYAEAQTHPKDWFGLLSAMGHEPSSTENGRVERLPDTVADRDGVVEIAETPFCRIDRLSIGAGLLLLVAFYCR